MAERRPSAVNCNKDRKASTDKSRQTTVDCSRWKSYGLTFILPPTLPVLHALRTLLCHLPCLSACASQSSKEPDLIHVSGAFGVTLQWQPVFVWIKCCKYSLCTYGRTLRLLFSSDVTCVSDWTSDKCFLRVLFILKKRFSLFDSWDSYFLIFLEY